MLTKRNICDILLIPKARAEENTKQDNGKEKQDVQPQRSLNQTAEGGGKTARRKRGYKNDKGSKKV